MPFVYRLQKVLNFRIQKKQEQLEVVKQAEAEVRRIEEEIEQNNTEIKNTRHNMRTSAAIHFEAFDKFLKHLYEIDEQLEAKKLLAIKKLEEEMEILTEMEKGVKVLEKHREKMLDQYKEEEKQKEMKVLNEIAGQKHFAKMVTKMEEELLEEIEDINEY